MNWFLWFLAAWLLLSTAVTVSMVGKPRKPTTAGDAAVIVIINALIIAGIFAFGAR